MPRKPEQKHDVAYRNAKPKAGGYVRVSDGGGLYLQINPDGGKVWRIQYAHPVTKKRNTLSLGPYPAVSVAEARSMREAVQKQLAHGIDPVEHRKQEAIKQKAMAESTFEGVAREWYGRNAGSWAPSHGDKVIRRLERDVFPWLGRRPIAEIKPAEVLAVVRRIEGRGVIETAHRALQNIGQVFRYGIQTLRADTDPTAPLKGALTPVQQKHFAALTEPEDFAGLLRAFNAFSGTLVVQCALRLLPLIFVRPGEIRMARWAEIDLDAAEWRYFVTKKKINHLVPLSKQAVAILRELHPLTGAGEYVFQGRDPKKPMSNMTLNAAIRRLGFDTQTEHTSHGFRASARTMLHERLGLAPEVIEHQLSHRVPDALGTAYNRTRFIKERRGMMQLWADYLDELKAGAVVLPFEKRVTK